MNNDEQHSPQGESTPHSTGKGQGQGQGRRRRRRGRRRGGNSGARTQNNNHNSQNAQQQSEQGSKGNNSSNGEGKGKGNRRRNRSRRGQGGNGQGGNGQNSNSSRNGSRGNGSRGNGGRRTRKGSPNRNNRRQYSSSRQAALHKAMDTRDETSAGGLVVSGLAEAVDDRGKVNLARIYVALIGRLDRRGRLLWSMPKGHVEPGEDHRSTAEREVWEETGVHSETFANLGTIDYWFVSDGVRIHKTVHHHLMRYVDGDLNDEDPEVTEVAWIPVSELIEHLAYADERKLARAAHDMLPDLARAEKEAGRRTPR